MHLHWLTLWGVTVFFFLFLFSCSILFYLVCAEVRSKERKILERAGVVQSLTVGVAPIVVVMASVCTFTLHMAMGYDLTAAEVSNENPAFSMHNYRTVCPFAFNCICSPSWKILVYISSNDLFFCRLSLWLPSLTP